jgi:hypothetical protein
MRTRSAGFVPSAARFLASIFLSALFSLSGTLSVAELIDDEEPGRPLHDVFDPLVLVPRRDHEAVALSMRLLVFRMADIKRGGARIVAAFAENVERFVCSGSGCALGAVDLKVDCAVHRLISRHAL